MKAPKNGPAGLNGDDIEVRLDHVVVEEVLGCVELVLGEGAWVDEAASH